MSRNLAVMAFGFLWLAFAASQVQAQTAQCAPRDLVLKHLGKTYGETRRAIGLAANNTVLELFASADSGSWTIIVTTAAGLTCLVASGQGYETVNDAASAEGAPA